MKQMNLDKKYLERRGLIMHGHEYKELTDNVREQFAMDAQPELTTSPNSGIMSMLTTYIDPKIVEVLFTPLKAVQVAGGERKVGDWLSTSVAFNLAEMTGEVSTYDDYSMNGVAKANLNFPQRQPYSYQVITQWGIKELERNSLTKVDWVNQLNISSISVLNRFQNQSYFFGVDGLQNYGLLNDPSLPSPISPISYAGPIVLWSAKTALQIYFDIVALFNQLSQVQANGNVDTESPMILAMSAYANTQLTKVTEFNVSVSDMIKKNFPNMKIVTAQQFATTSGQLVRLRADADDGQVTEECSFPEKLRSFSVIVQPSSYAQKKMQGTNGAIIYRPFLVASMLGV
jgi:hypothetical protein